MPATCDAAPWVETDDLLRLRLGEELDYARRMLDMTGDELVGRPDRCRRHAWSMQSLDIVGQMLGHIADVIRSSDPRRRWTRSGCPPSKARLTRSGAL